MRFSLKGLGTATPPHRIRQTDAAAVAQTFCCTTEQEREWLSTVYERSGIETRASVLLENGIPGTVDRQSFYPPLADPADRGPTTAARMARYETESPGLAIEAGRKALESANCDPRSLTHLVTVSCSGFSSPGFDVAMIRELGLPSGISRTHVGFMGCHGALIGMKVARAFALAEPDARVLLCALELCTLHHQYGWNVEWIVANGLFADGAGAVVGWGEPHRDSGEWQVARHGSAILAGTEACMGWRIGDNGFEMQLTQAVPRMIGEHLRAWVEPWLAQAGYRLADIPTWAIHPGGPKVLSVTRDALGLSADQLQASQEVLREYGNMSSPTILFIIERLRQRGASLPCVALAFGPGLSIEAALIVQ